MIKYYKKQLEHYKEVLFAAREVGDKNAELRCLNEIKFLRERIMES